VSRALQLAMSESEALALCHAENVTVSTIERLPGGGVRLVCNSSSGAEIMRRKAKSKILEVEQTREKHRPRSPLW
jgi:hypothetical protein